MNTTDLNVTELASDYAVSPADIREALGLSPFQVEILDVTAEREAAIHEQLAARFL